MKLVAAPSQTYLLLVEDDPSILELMQVVARMSGYRSRSAKSGLEALKFLQEENFDLVISDENLPGLKGHEIAEWMQSSERYGATPFILTSAEHDPRLFADFQRRGLINCFMPKPFSLAQFKSTVGLALSVKFERRTGRMVTDV